MSDSPRWCAHCQSYGDHHTDRCPEDGLEPWERCGCAACQATMATLYGTDAEVAAAMEKRP